ncbi:hypothetical protein ACIPIN_26815 [Pseudomonas sp. NPDC087697]|uniref:hypothetical protein n=1 Tax=Pseudomonas sp. NPDC087697 TaxID=3364447 RepID=UPI0037FC1100
MFLKSPFENVDLPWEPRLSYILAGLEIYDREEAIGEALRKYNPNLSRERYEIIKEFVLRDLEYLSYRHRLALFEILEKALADSDFDFSTQFESDYDECITIAWDETEIDDPRGFFEDIYRLASEEWKDDLQKASLEDRTAW